MSSMDELSSRAATGVQCNDSTSLPNVTSTMKKLTNAKLPPLPQTHSVLTNKLSPVTQDYKPPLV